MEVTFKLGDTAFSELVQPRIVKNDVVFVFFVLALRQRSSDVVLVVGEEREAAFEVSKLVHTVKRERRRGGGGGGFERVETEFGSDGVPVLETVSFNRER